MAIRIRKVKGITIALCAQETDEKKGDLYLDDGIHYALAAKFALDWESELGYEDEGYQPEWPIMATQKVRNAN